LRVTLAVISSLGTVTVSILVGLAAYLASRHFLVAQRERTALAQTYADAATIIGGLPTAGAEVREVLVQQAGTDRDLILYVSGRWYTTSVSRGLSGIPDDVVAGVKNGSVTYAWTAVDEEPALVVGVPLASVGGELYEIVRTPALASTLSTFQWALSACVVLGGALGAVLGVGLASRVLRPLRRIATSAAGVQTGGPSERVAGTSDPDLLPIVHSLNSLMDALDDRRQRDIQFAADAAHELRSPLMTLTTSLTVVRNRDADLAPAARTAVDLMSREVTRLRHTLEDLLELGRLSDSSAQGQLVDVDPVELARETLRVGGRATSLLEGRPGTAEISVDKSRVARALLNLLDNADIHGGGVQRLVVTTPPGKACFHVWDAGPGIPEAERERVFERFARGARTARSGRAGSGLGLSIVREIATSCGGSVTIGSGADGGTVVTLDLPRAPRGESRATPERTRRG